VGGHRNFLSVFPVEIPWKFRDMREFGNRGNSKSKTRERGPRGYSERCQRRHSKRRFFLEDISKGVQVFEFFQIRESGKTGFKRKGLGEACNEWGKGLRRSRRPVGGGREKLV
jgi:hypothetical protein